MPTRTVSNHRMFFKKPLSWKTRLGLALVPTLAILAVFLGRLLRGECAVGF